MTCNITHLGQLNMDYSSITSILKLVEITEQNVIIVQLLDVVILFYLLDHVQADFWCGILFCMVKWCEEEDVQVQVIHAKFFNTSFLLFL